MSFFMVLNIAIANTLSEKDVPEKKRTKAGLYLNAKGAYTALEQEAEKIIFLDIRTRGEIAYTGMPTVADANVPFKFTSKKFHWNDKKNNFKMTPNPGFVATVIERVQQKGLSKNDKVFVMCRSGGRSAKAADALTDAGFTQVFSVIDGFEGDSVKSGEQKGKRTLNGWKNSNLPWSFKLDKTKMYVDGKKEGKAGKMLKKMDTDKDNSVSQSEFDAFHKMMFGKIDQNKNSILDEQEIKAFKKQRKQEKKQKKEKAKL